MTGAALGERFGRRRMFAAGLAVFSPASQDVTPGAIATIALKSVGSSTADCSAA